MTCLKQLLTVSLLLLLTACSGAGIAAISTIGSAAMVYGGQVIAKDTAEAENWRNNHQMLVTECNTSLLIRVRDITTTGFDETLARCDKLMLFSYNNMPEIFIERMSKRVIKLKAKK
ncbi:hypothetical protein LCGC14_1997190 [marine sediment metagenome]|uniref:Uncharacterized protein n=1 Tax=marine sediment metagenome TaxID=412755 RepID=A0A0F9I1E4_9ZZZZ